MTKNLQKTNKPVKGSAKKPGIFPAKMNVKLDRTVNGGGRNNVFPGAKTKMPKPSPKQNAKK